MDVDAQGLPYADSSIDLIVAIVAAHWFDPDKFSAELRRVLKPNGVVALSRGYGAIVRVKEEGGEESFEITPEQVSDYAQR